MSEQPQTFETSLGPNGWLVEEMYEQFRANPNDLSADWRAYFANYQPLPAPRPTVGAPSVLSASTATAVLTPPAATNGGNGLVNPASTPAPTPTPASSPVAQPTSPAPVPSAAPVPNSQLSTDSSPQPLRGVAAKIVTNMEASLGVPTATSMRPIPAKLLEVNRRIINNYLVRARGGKISFTHLIAYAVVQAIKENPALNNVYVEQDGNPAVVRSPHVGLGLAVDVPKSDGSRSLLVVCIKNAEQFEFQQFWAEYENLVRKVKSNQISPDDFSGVTVTLTNPGTIGTVSSVPRLMPGQGAIIGVGAIDYPAEYQAADPRALASMGVSKTVTLTSTYDHRVIQGAESGLFLQRVHELLIGKHDFYENIFMSIGVPYTPAQWAEDRSSVDDEDTREQKQLRVKELIDAYRTRGHLIADLDPLDLQPVVMHPDLEPSAHELSIWDLERKFLTGGLAGRDTLPLGTILKILRDAYCRTIGIQYMHIQEPEEKLWIQEQVEGKSFEIPKEDQRHLLERLNAAEAFEKFLHTKYVGHKRFGLEGAESFIPILESVLEEAGKAGVEDAVLGMAHRGRLNVLANVIGVSYGQLFRQFEGDIDPNTIQGSGDVKYHIGAEGEFRSRFGDVIDIALASNPSHLEAVDPVVEGIVRAKQDLLGQPADFPVLPILIHGDAAFAGQGVVGETLNLSQLRGYITGGTVHIVINNQVGFTTNTRDGRSSTYCTDVALTVQAPVFHVNGDDPEACVRVAKLAFAYRNRFHKDVVIDLVCYRRHGHNEGDEPSYTQPKMYRTIDAKDSVRKLYTEALVARGDFSDAEADQVLADFSAKLQGALDETRQTAPPKIEELPNLHPITEGIWAPVDTTAPQDVLDSVTNTLLSFPPDFTIHPKLMKQVEARQKLYADGQIDWALGELLAYGSLLKEGVSVRLAGEDSRRGTFSHRHAAYFDYHSGDEYVPLHQIAEPRGRFYVYDSLLSEYAALGFEYGYSVANPAALTVWEAQFGDFANGGQIIIDQFISAAEAKWNQQSGLVMLLPHGFEGQGPEHSSARLERFLQMCADDNMTVANVTTASQLFHILRRQVKRSFRKPLVIMSPKSLLRSRNAYSTITDLVSGTFEPILDDVRIADRNAVKRVILATGKVAFDAIEHRDANNLAAAVIRVEQLFPFPEEKLLDTIAQYENAADVVWLQEEPENMGAWIFVLSRITKALGTGHRLQAVCRAESASPATGMAALHTLEQQDIIHRAFAGL